MVNTFIKYPQLLNFYKTGLLFFIFSMCLGTLFIITILTPQFISGGEWLIVSDFESLDGSGTGNHPKNLEPWSYSKQGVLWEADTGFKNSAGVKLTSVQQSSPYLEWVIENPRRFQCLEFDGKMRTAHIIEGEKSWQAARFMVFYKDSEGKSHWDYPHEAGRLSGSSDWQNFSRVFPVPDFAASAHVMINNNALSGSMWCDDITVKPVMLNPRFLLARSIFLIFGSALLIAFVIHFKLYKNDGLLVLSVFAIIICGVLCPEHYIRTIAHNLGVTDFVLKKSGHLILFFLLTLISIRRLGYELHASAKNGPSASRIILVFISLSLVAASAELLQLLTIDRSPTFQDWLIDIIGILTGIVFAALLSRR